MLTNADRVRTFQDPHQHRQSIRDRCDLDCGSLRPGIDFTHSRTCNKNVNQTAGAQVENYCDLWVKSRCVSWIFISPSNHSHRIHGELLLFSFIICFPLCNKNFYYKKKKTQKMRQWLPRVLFVCLTFHITFIRHSNSREWFDLTAAATETARLHSVSACSCVFALHCSQAINSRTDSIQEQRPEPNARKEKNRKSSSKAKNKRFTMEIKRKKQTKKRMCIGCSFLSSSFQNKNKIV